MCGIFGVIALKNANMTIKHLEFIKDAFIVGSLRGLDSSGLLTIDKDKEISIYKKAMSGFDFAFTPRVNRLLNLQCRGIFGHHRSATGGVVKDSNAHPFSEGHITLMHNGTIHNYYSLTKGNTYNKIDSAVLCEAINDTDNLDELLNKVSGSFSLVWYDDRDDSFNFARNEERPMHCAVSKDGDWLFASEEGMLKWLMDRNRIEIADKIISLAPWYLHKMKLLSDKIAVVSTEIERKKENPLTVVKTEAKTDADTGKITKLRESLKSDGLQSVEKVRWKKWISYGSSESNFRGKLTGHTLKQPNFNEVEINGVTYTEIKHLLDKEYYTELTNYFVLNKTDTVYTSRLSKVFLNGVAWNTAGDPVSALTMKEAVGCTCITCKQLIQSPEGCSEWAKDGYMCAECTQGFDSMLEV